MKKNAVVILTRGYKKLDEYILLIERNINIDLNLIDKSIDILIFNENNITIEQQEYIKSKTPLLNIKFISILEHAFNKEKEKIIPYYRAKQFKIGYRHMCSFWFVNFWNYVIDYDKILRIDEDCNIQFSIDKVFELLNDKKFIFGKWDTDCDFVTIGLNHFTMDFLNNSIEHRPAGPYTNVFGLNLLELRKNTILKKYIEEIDISNNIYIFRWGDLPLWGEVLFYLYNKDDYLCTPLIKYYHESHNLYINDNSELNWGKYISYYPDLKDLNNKDSAINHWNINGIYENRIYFKNDNYINFDWETYVNSYCDIKYTVSSKDEAIEHWEKYGSNENRIFFNLYNYNIFDWEKYINYYNDLNFLKRKEEAIAHFEGYGIYEGRIFFKKYIYNEYDDFYWDLYIKYYNLNNINSKIDTIQHWINNRLNKNYIFFKISDYKNFYWEKYVFSYKDLSNIINNKEDAIVHWLKYGINEDRISYKVYSDPIKVFINKLALSYNKLMIDLMFENIQNHIITNNYDDANIIISHILEENKYFNDNSKLKILLSGEPFDAYEDYDLFITTFKSDSNKCIYYPYIYYSLYEHRLSINHNDYKNISKTKFCSYMYSREFDHRKYYFNLVSKYKRVDALGKCCNNVNINNTRTVYNDDITYNDIAVKLYAEYKFVLAIENTDRKGYATEKLINPIIAGSIPIYWGNSDIFNYINKKRVIYIGDFENENDLMSYIIYIDNNNYEYNKIINENTFIIDHNEINNKFKEDISQILLTKLKN